MSTALSGYYPNMLDMLKATDPNGDPALIVELLSQTNEILQDMPIQQGNLKTGHRTTVRTGLPAVVWTSLYGFVPSSKSRTQQVDDTCGRLETRSEIDTRLLDLQKNPAGVIANEQIPFLEAMNQEMAGDIFYCDTALYPNKFLGLSPRYPTSSTANVVDAQGTGSNCTSIWYIVWGPQTVFGITPENVPGGMKVKDRGIEKVQGVSSQNEGVYYARVHTYEWHLGLCIRDWRYIVRCANINMAAGATDGIFTLDLLWDMIGSLPSPYTMGAPGHGCFYMHRNLWTQINKLAMNKTNAALGWADIFGHRVPTFDGKPIRQCDQILLTESAI